MLNFLLQDQNRTKYIQHYENLVTRYEHKKEIVDEYRNLAKERIRTKASNGHYKFYIYTKINPELTTSPFLEVFHPTVGDILKFRLGSHYLPIETGRWSGRPRHERFSENCNEVGDEDHVIYRCSLIERGDLTLHEDLSLIGVDWCNNRANPDQSAKIGTDMLRCMQFHMGRVSPTGK